MIKKIRLWLADKLITLAMMANFDSVLLFVIESMETLDKRLAEERVVEARDKPTKRGRPKGSKDSKPRVAREGVKLGRPAGRKDSAGKAVNGGGHA
jgi:hypothetical protein